MIGRMLAEDQYWNVDNKLLDNNQQPDAYTIIQSTNLYVYCNGNPILFIDITGFVWYSSAFNKSSGTTVNVGPLSYSSQKNTGTTVSVGPLSYSSQKNTGTTNKESAKKQSSGFGASASAGFNLAQVGNRGDSYDVNMTLGSISSKASFLINGSQSKVDIGVSAEASLYKVSGTKKISIPFTDKAVSLTATGTLGFGAKAGFTSDGITHTATLGLSAGIGGGVSASIGPR